MKHIGLVISLLIFSFSLGAQTQNLDATAIQMKLKKLTSLGSVLYIAAHPDDENTRLISYLVNERNIRTGYLSLTRGDGGQNLVGTEKGALMGVLRTQELLEARKIDGGEQYFTRAVDFGYSKNPEETFTKWDKQKILADVVWAIRKFQPDIIVTRFPSTSDAGHGHHSASAILAAEAFELAADEKSFPEQLKLAGVWQAKRLFFNNSSWWDKELPDKAKAQPEKYIALDIGMFNPMLGISYSELASMSRSEHKSQGFGSGMNRGSHIEYMELLKGEPLKNDPFDDIDISWNRIEKGEALLALSNKMYNAYTPSNPAASLADLLAFHQQLSTLKDGVWKSVKLEEVETLIMACAGIWLEAVADSYSSGEASTILIEAQMISRGGVNTQVKRLRIANRDTAMALFLPQNEMTNIKLKTEVVASDKTNPYWLNAPFEGVFEVENQRLIGASKNQPVIAAKFDIDVEGYRMVIDRPVVFKWTDRVKGEMYRPFVSMPKITANISNSILIFSDATEKEVKITLKAHENNVAGKVKLLAGKDWSIRPVEIDYNLKEKGQEKTIVFMVQPPNKASTTELVVESGGRLRSVIEVEYDHVQTQTMLPTASSKLVRLDLRKNGDKVGYIVGAGDEVPIALEQLGYEVTLLDEALMKSTELSQFDAIVCGIRAYNKQPYMEHMHEKLMRYVHEGGNYVVQYNTAHGLVTEDIGPYPLKVSRDRVTVEEATPTLLDPNHAVLNTPNKMLATDFDNWIQERGLYFPSDWDESYTPIIGWSDPGEDRKDGALLVSHYGKGSFIYTGISFFRELPAGVPGAFKLMANIVSYKRQDL